jgi:hypothetical protein
VRFVKIGRVHNVHSLFSSLGLRGLISLFASRLLWLRLDVIDTAARLCELAAAGIGIYVFAFPFLVDS